MHVSLHHNNCFVTSQCIYNYHPAGTSSILQRLGDTGLDIATTPSRSLFLCGETKKAHQMYFQEGAVTSRTIEDP